ncbi:MAG: DUF3226 domain-containing protein [Pirellulaceae bacterium]
MSRRNNHRRLLVEGRVEQRLIPYLIEENGIPWGEKRDEAIVDIEEFNGVDNLLKPGVIEAELKASGLKHLGIVVDADDDLASRWHAVRNRCILACPSISDRLPSEGLVVETSRGVTLGVWIMPDNASSGMLETFLCFLLPNQSDPLHKHAIEATGRAKELGAPFVEAHESKSHIHTWLAWQDPPGRQLHEAVAERVLNPLSENAQPFVRWFKTVFAL